MTDERRAELRRIAEAATPGPRHIQLRRDIADEYESWLMPLNLYLCEGLPDEDAAYIAAFDRETCLALLDAADRVAGWTTMGVGDGSGKLFVHGDYESIKAAQAKVIQCGQLKVENEQLLQRIATLEAELAALKGASQ